MASTSLAKKPASFMRERIAPFRDHAAAMAKLADQFIAAVEREQAKYFEGVKKVTAVFTERASQETASPEQAESTEHAPSI